MYIVESNEYNELKFWDDLSGTHMTLYYSMPDTKTMIGYEKSIMSQGRGNKVKLNIGATRMEYGKKILMGFSLGCFGLPYDRFNALSENVGTKERLERLRLSEKSLFRLKDDEPDLVVDGATYRQWDILEGEENLPKNHETKFVKEDLRYIPYTGLPAESPFYVKAWKELVADSRPDIIKSLALKVFEASLDFSDAGKEKN